MVIYGMKSAAVRSMKRENILLAIVSGTVHFTDVRIKIQSFSSLSLTVHDAMQLVHAYRTLASVSDA